MAARRSSASLPSDLHFLLELIVDIPEESGSSEEEFDGYLGPNDGPVTYAHPEDYDCGTTFARSQSLDSLTEEQTKSPLPCMSPSLSPMDGQLASGSPRAASPSHSFSHAQDACLVYI